MADYRLSRNARIDLKRIAAYSLTTFGLDTARSYRASLFEAFERLVIYPDSGMRVDHIKTGVRKLVVESHIVFYRMKQEDVQILRILHHSQDPLRHL